MLSIAIVLVLWAVAGFALQRDVRTSPVELDVEVRVPCTGTAQMFLDTGAGFTEQQSILFAVARGHNHLRTSTADSALKAFRVDPPACAKRFGVKSVKATGPYRSIFWKPDAVRKHVALSHDATVSLKQKEVEAAIHGADPYVVVEAPRAIRKLTARFFLTLGLIFLLTAVFVEVSYRVVRKIEVVRPIANALDRISGWVNDPDLIVLERRSQLVFVVVLLGTLLLSVLKIHADSIAMWNVYVPQADTDSVLLGTPLGIRSDEWKTLPAALSPRPIDWTWLIHVRSWGYFFGPEWGVAWARNLIHPYQFLTCFALLLQFTRNAFWPSLIGSSWITLSSYVQWWGGATETGDLALLVIGTSYFLLARQLRHVILGALLLGSGLSGFLAALYPPWQVPLGYWGLSVVLVSALAPSARPRLYAIWQSKVAIGLIGLGVAAVAGYYAWRVVGADITVMASTVYPGERRSESGSVSLVWLFSGFYDLFYEEGRFPLRLGNVCEAANFIFLFPCSAVLIAIRAAQRKPVPLVATVTLVHIGLLLWWMLGPVSPVIAKWTLMDRVPPLRALGPLGAESIVIASVMMSPALGKRTFEGRLRPVWIVAGLVATLAALIFHGKQLQSEDPIYYTDTVLMVGIALTLLLASGLWLDSVVVYGLGVLLAVGPNAAINPINRGFAPVEGKDIVRVARRLRDEDPSAKWLVYGGMVEPKLLAAAGVDVFNNRSYPQPDEMAVLDPGGKYKNVWNRYSAFRNVWEIAPDAGADFVTPQLDVWGMGISPASPLLDRIGVGFVVFLQPPSWESLDFLQQATPGHVNNQWVFRRGSRFVPSGALVETRTETPTGCATLSITDDRVETTAFVPENVIPTDALIREGDAWHRCFFEMPTSPRPAAAALVTVRCPRTNVQLDPTVKVLLGQDSVLTVTQGSHCSP